MTNFNSLEKNSVDYMLLVLKVFTYKIEKKLKITNSDDSQDDWEI